MPAAIGASKASVASEAMTVTGTTVHTVGLPGKEKSATAASATHTPASKSLPNNLENQSNNAAQTANGEASPVGPGVLQTGASANLVAGVNHGNSPTNQVPLASSSSTPLDGQSLNAMSAQLHVLHQAGGGHAALQLDPPSLGSVHIQLHLQSQNQVQVMFTVTQSATVQVLQANLAQLATALHQNGIHLTHSEVNASVNANLPDQPGQQGQQHGFTADQFSGRATSGSGTSSAPKGRPNPGVRAYA